MRRREFVGLIGSAAVWPLAAGAQQKPMPVIGYLHFASPEYPMTPSFVQGLKESGYIEGKNVAIEYRYAENHYERLPALATDLVERGVDLIAAIGPPPALAAKNATSTIPVVFLVGDDPIADGLVTNLARPSSNLTGVSMLAVDLTLKRLELILEILPKAKVIALLVNPKNPNPWLAEAQEGARAKGLNFSVLKATTEGEIDAAFATLAKANADAVVIGDDAFFSGQREQLVALASRYGIPTVERWSEFAEAGGLISYGSSLSASYRLAGTYAGRILKGEKVSDLPVQQPTTFKLAVNLKTARALGLSIPPSILAIADEVIE
jgi:putative ABC transport system substrate-binding protein